MSAPAIRSLEEAAQALAAAQSELGVANAEVELLKPAFDAAVERRAEARRQVKRIEQGMDGVKRAYAVSVALREQGIDTDDPPIVVQQAWTDTELPKVWTLVAVAGDGTGLYLYTPRRSHRYEGKRWAIRFERAPEGTEPERYDKMKGAGLVYWDERGKGAWGAGSGSIKAKRAPDGGRWRHLKIREQEELTP